MMTEVKQRVAICDLAPLNESDIELSQFWVRDSLWSAVVELFDRYREDEECSYAALGRRIGRSRAQVQRWLSAPKNMTIQSAGLIAEGLDADLVVHLVPRSVADFTANYAHPCDDAKEFVAHFSAKQKSAVVSRAGILDSLQVAPNSAIAAPNQARTSFTFNVNE